LLIATRSVADCDLFSLLLAGVLRRTGFPRGLAKAHSSH
jgi:hypothetical protein